MSVSRLGTLYYTEETITRWFPDSSVTFRGGPRFRVNGYVKPPFHFILLEELNDQSYAWVLTPEGACVFDLFEIRDHCRPCVAITAHKS